MSEKNVLKTEKILVVLLVLTFAFIWGNSLMPDTVSEAISGTVKEIINELVGITGSSGMSGDGILRKIAHGVEYAILGLEVENLFHHHMKKERSLVFLTGLSTAVIDETIQLFVRGRAGMIQDVWIDMGGFFTGIILIIILHKIRCRGAK